MNEEQFKELEAFFFYVWNYHHNKKDPYYQRPTNDFAFYAEKLDKLQIPWRTQNLVSAAAEKRENGFSSFSQILKNLTL